MFDNIVNEPRLHKITLRHVLSHTLGFPNWPGKGEKLQIYLPSGQQFSYSGSGFMFLQHVIAHLTNHIPQGFIHSSLLEPLGMVDSNFLWTEEGAAGQLVAQPHDAEGVRHDKRYWKEFNAAASLHCTPTDFARFMLAILSPASAKTSALDQALQEEMLTPQIQVNDSFPWQEDWPRADAELMPDVFWGLGWGLQRDNGRFAFWHWGDNGNFKAFTVGFPDEGSGIVLMCNGRNADKLWLKILQQAYGGSFPALTWLGLK